ncbi:MAG TPA: GGDEF domain-containing protein, partial [Synergistaceae bacterium]|nr:GGDEF domain-containing protein [Synergistaceae bacterium]
NPAAEVLFDCDASAVTGKPFWIPIGGEGSREVSLPSSQGGNAVGDMRVVRSNWDGEGVMLATIRDVTETVRLRERLEVEAVSDALTGLFNRRGFFKIAPGRLSLAERMDLAVVCFFADLDNFKQVNDLLGHEEGDQVLREAAEVLKKTFRESDLLARIGGDEFAVLMVQDRGEKWDGESACAQVKARLERNLELCHGRSSRPYRLAMSVGFAVAQKVQGISLDALVAEADGKMYENKAAKRSCSG